MTSAAIPEPGDFACVPIRGETGKLIGLAEHLAASKSERGDCNTPWHYQHAFIYVGHGKIIQAEPDGAKLVGLPKYYEPWAKDALWSSGRLMGLTSAQRTRIVAAAEGLNGVPYSFLDYTALAMHKARIPRPGLRHYIASSGHMICSQLVDWCYQFAGVHLFSDGRWPGYVMPEDLAGVIDGTPRTIFADHAVATSHAPGVWYEARDFDA